WCCCCYRCWGWRSALDSLLKSQTILDLVVAASALQAFPRNHPTLRTTMCLPAMGTLLLHTRGTLRRYLCTAGCYRTLRCLVHCFLLVLLLECSCRPLLRSLLLFQILLHLALLSTSSTKCLVQETGENPSHHYQWNLSTSRISQDPLPEYNTLSRPFSRSGR
ncbi:hypothetical protein Taro_053443, partial [Colocasia esculenta]|nr:hypothetical protein [Colocasia esculenta]